MTRARPRSVDPAIYDQHEAAIAVIMNTFLVHHLIETYKAFNGDLVEAIVLGEIAHHNLAAERASALDAHDLSRRLPGDGSRRPALLPTNAYSIAEACGIPRETVRRKVARLERRGWIVRDGSGNLFVTSQPQSHFTDSNRARCAELLEAAREIEGLLGSRRGEARARRSHASGTRQAPLRRPGTPR